MKKYIGKRGGFTYLSIGKLVLIIGRGNFGQFKESFGLQDKVVGHSMVYGRIPIEREQWSDSQEYK